MIIWRRIIIIINFNILGMIKEGIKNGNKLLED